MEDTTPRVIREGNLALYPTVPRYSQDSDVTYGGRQYRWVVLWLGSEPRPDQWYATEQEVQAYRVWRDGLGKR